ncbi:MULTISPECIES: glycosyltransferase 87 family protein [unclassified Agrococcus]|uniref:glycosyltransferase 87 family protein n=1 Tax=unclassified Agrococcus TaxID=2615065 RepID=UPI00361C7E83
MTRIERAQGGLTRRASPVVRRARTRALQRARAIALHAPPWREPRTVWMGFALLQVVTLASFAAPMLAGDVLGDLPLYREWALDAAEGRGIVGIDEPWVYPLLAWLPIALASVASAPAFLTIWLAMLGVLDALALRAILASGSARASIAGWAWLCMLLTLGPVALLRLEGVTAPLVVIAVTMLARRPWAAGVLLAAATWIKVWPVALVASALVVMRERGRILQAGIVVTAGVVAAAVVLGDVGELASFATMQGDRDLQLEAPLATPWVWMAMLHVPGASVSFDVALETREVAGPFDGLAQQASTPLMLLGTIAALVLARIAVRRGADRHETLMTTALMVTIAMFACNRVGSPQYMLWILPVAIVAIATVHAGAQRWWRRMTAVLLATGLVTTIVFPISYLALIDLHVWAVVLLTARNVLLVVVLAAAARRMVVLAVGRSTLDAVRASRLGGMPEGSRVA